MFLYAMALIVIYQLQTLSIEAQLKWSKASKVNEGGVWAVE